MLIYRVEHAQYRNGPYTITGLLTDDEDGTPWWEYPDKEALSNLSTALHDSHSWGLDADTHPCPEEDGIIINSGDVCGFASMNDLRMWFEGFDKRLADNDFKVYVYKVLKKKVQVGSMQVVFNPEDAEYVEQFSLLSSR